MLVIANSHIHATIAVCASPPSKRAFIYGPRIIHNMLEERYAHASHFWASWRARFSSRSGCLFASIHSAAYIAMYNFQYHGQCQSQNHKKKNLKIYVYIFWRAIRIHEAVYRVPCTVRRASHCNGTCHAKCEHIIAIIRSGPVAPLFGTVPLQKLCSVWCSCFLCAHICVWHASICDRWWRAGELANLQEWVDVSRVYDSIRHRLLLNHYCLYE